MALPVHSSTVIKLTSAINKLFRVIIIMYSACTKLPILIESQNGEYRVPNKSSLTLFRKSLNKSGFEC